MANLPPLPSFRLEPLGDDAGEEGRRWLILHRHRLRAHMPDGTTSEPFTYDAVTRRALDAVVVAAHFRDASGRRHVWLRSAVRPPVALRPRDSSPIAERDTLGGLWEVPAGLVEADEQSPEGLLRCAARELHEELGADLPASAFRALGPSSFPAPGIIGERHFYFEVELPPARRTTPVEDGSVLERQAVIVALPLDDALALVRAGEIEDAKTEIALRRLAET